MSKHTLNTFFGHKMAWTRLQGNVTVDRSYLIKSLGASFAYKHSTTPVFFSMVIDFRHNSAEHCLAHRLPVLLYTKPGPNGDLGWGLINQALEVSCSNKSTPREE